MRELVIDVSHCDPDIDIAAWKSKRGIWGVIVKCGGYESLGKDSNGRKLPPEHYQTRVFERHYKATVDAGLHVGSYYYSVATDVETARRNAEHCASILKGHSFDLPIYLDVEDSGQLGIGRRKLTDVCLAFVTRLRELGHNAGVYSYRSMLEECMYGKELEPYPLWIAEYSNKCHTDLSHGMWQFGAMRLSDGDVFWGDKEGYVDANWLYVDYTNGGSKVTRIHLSEIAARIHYDMVTDERNGYSQLPDRWGGDYGDTKTLEIFGRKYTYKPGSYDCSSSTILACRLALQGTKWEGKLDAATCTSDMRRVFVNSGLFYAKYSSAKRGDLYLAEGKHVAMCQDGGSDGVFGYDCLSEFNVNEKGTATYGKPGDQTGRESVFRGYYDDEWNTVLHWNDNAYIEVTEGGKMAIEAHVQSHGWMGFKGENETVGTTGQAKRLEGFHFSIPSGMDFSLYLHMQGVGDITYQHVKEGMEAICFGSEGAARRLEAFSMKLNACTNPAYAGKRFQYRGHIQGTGWTGWVDGGTVVGTIGQGKRLEAIEYRFV